MKKYLYASLITVLMSLTIACENDPITISYGVPVKVDPSGVIAPFTYEINTGELESFDTSYKLRVRLLAYDAEGKLAASDSTFLTNYAGIMNSSITLSEGSYTLITITDIVKHNSNKTTFQYWYLSDISDINKVRLTNAGYMGLIYKVVGAGSKQIVVRDGETTTVTINPKPVGALLCIRFKNIHEYTNVTEYELQTNRNADFMTFDSYGNGVTIPENKNNSFNWRVNYIDPNDYSQYSNVYGWNYMFPVNNANFRFVYSTDEVSDDVLVTDMIVNLRAGDEYLFLLDLCDEEMDDAITYWYGMVNGTASRSVQMPDMPWVQRMIADSQNTARLKDLLKISH